jgi:hypothetical protein
MCMFCRSLLVFLYFFFWPLYCLFLFDLRILYNCSGWITLFYNYLHRLLFSTLVSWFLAESHWLVTNCFIYVTLWQSSTAETKIIRRVWRYQRGNQNPFKSLSQTLIFNILIMIFMIKYWHCLKISISRVVLMNY